MRPCAGQRNHPILRGDGEIEAIGVHHLGPGHRFTFALSTPPVLLYLGMCHWGAAMRVAKRSDGLTINAIAGTYVVFFGLDLTEDVRSHFRGFAFRRTDTVEGETIWLRGLKTFQEIEPYPARGETFSTRDHPIQSFQWADYSAKPGRHYVYEIHALYGAPGALESRIEIKIPITTEAETGKTHSAFFNRGSVATQEYARRFENQPPSKAGPGAYEWLSRGLLEALVKFIDDAGQSDELHGAIYEFQWPAVLDALRMAKKRGVKVSILFDNIEAYKDGKPVGPWKRNREAIAAAKIKGLCKGRENGKLMHNKFFVLSRGGVPKAVWSGSTNLSENGIFGHSNLGHIVVDDNLAKAFRDYWDRIEADLKVGEDYRDQNVAASPIPQGDWSNRTTAIFSPRGTDLDALEWYARIAAGAKGALFMTFAFGMHELFKGVYNKDDQILRMALLEKEGNNPKTLERDRKDIRRIRNRPNVVVALGNRITTNAFDRWLVEMLRLRNDIHVYWVHTKYMIVDPLSANPTIVTGSANFSKASTDTNDENMLVINGDKRISDIYFGEFLRLYNHYAFRESVKRYMERKKTGSPEEWKPQFLETKDSWMRDYFDPADTSARNARRTYFAGPMAV